MPKLPDGYAPGTVVPKSLLPKIGLVNAQFAALDAEMNRAIWKFMGVPEGIGRAVTQTVISFRTRTELFARLVRMSHSNVNHDRINDIRRQLRVAADDRNSLVHDEPAGGHVGTETYLVQRGNRTGKDYKMYVFDTSTINDLVERMMQIRRILMWLCDDDGRWLTEPLLSLDNSPTERARQARDTPSDPAKRKA